MELVTSISADLKTSQQFPVHIIQTEKRPDIVAWSDSKKSVLLIELTFSLGRKPGGGTQAEENRYETQHGDCMDKGWICHVISIEVGCRGFLGHSFRFFQK